MSRELPSRPALEALEPRDVPSIDLRVVSYNVAHGARPGLDTLIQGIGREVVNGQARQVDLVALQEINTQAAEPATLVGMLNAIYGPGAYDHGEVNAASLDGDETVGVVYRTRSLELVEELPVTVTMTGAGAEAQPIRYKFRPVGAPTGSDFYVFNCSYASGDTNPARRALEAEEVRANADALGQGVSILYVGDHNTQSSNEPGFQTLLGAGNGQALDPIDRPGAWHHKAAFIDTMTQATSNNPPAGFTGGGLDDRFDFQLVSQELTDGAGLEYRAGTYHAFGNNGSVALDGSINDAGNTALAGLDNRLALLDLLTTVSDHLPVVADYTIGGPAVAGSVAAVFGTETWRWSPAEGWRLLAAEAASELDIADDGAVVGVFAGGVYRWDAAGTFQGLTGYVPDQIELAGDGTVFGDFGTAGIGLWRWTPAAGWLGLTGQNAAAIEACDDGSVVGSFPNGLWRWAGGWQGLTGAVPAAFVVADDGATYGTFNGPQVFGVWRWQAGAWLGLTGAVPVRVTVSDAGDLFGDFGQDGGPDGLWRWDGRTRTWSPLSSAGPVRMTATRTGNLVADFGADGLFLWDRRTAAFTRLDAAATQGFGVSTDGSVFADFGAAGLVRYVEGVKTTLTSFDPIRLAARR